MTSLFDDIQQFDDGFAAKRREAAAVAHKRVQDRVGSYLRLSKTTEEFNARFDFVHDDIRQIVADVAEEYSVDHDKLVDAIEENLRGEGVTDINGELADAPSAVGQKAAGGHKDGCECGFCKNKGNLPGRVDQDEQRDKDASEPDDSDTDKKESSKQSTPFRTDPATCPQCHGGMTLSTSREAQQNGAPLEYDCPQCGYHGASEEHQPGRMEFQEGLGDLLPRGASTHVAEAPRDGGGAVKRVDLPKGDGKAVGTEPSPKMDKKKWKPNALGEGNLPAVPEGIEMDGSPNPTKQQDIMDKPDYEGDFLRDTDAVTTQQDLPAANDSGQSTERNLSQEGQSGTWTEGGDSAVTPQVFASADPDVNPLKAILDAGFVPNNQVESAIEQFDSSKE